MIEIFENQKLNRIVVTLLIILCTIIVWVIVKKLMKMYKKKREGDEGTEKTVTSLKLVISDIIKVFIVTIIILTILQVNGINVTSLIAGLGVMSAVVGLALQDFFKDIIMGMHILMDDFYKVGDVIAYGEDIGTVVSFNLRTTKIVSLRNGNIVTLCNRNIVEASKYSNEIHMTLPLPYEMMLEDMQRIMKNFEKEIVENPHVETCEYQGIGELADSVVMCKIKILTPGPEHMFAAKRAANDTYHRIMEEEDFSIPYNHLDVHIMENKN